MSRKFNYKAQDYYNNTQQIDIDSQCNTITFINKGNTVLIAAGVTLMPSPLNVNPGDRYAGESYTVGGNEGEIFSGKALIQFIAPVGTEPCVTVIQKYYVA